MGVYVQYICTCSEDIVENAKMSLREIDPYDYISEPESNICVAVLSYIFVISILPKIEKIPWNVCVASITFVIH